VSGDIVLNGVIYVNAVGLEPGANGGPPGQVPPGGATIAMNCQGKQGAPNGNGGHAGGGGGGFATAGAPGGTVCESPPCCDTDAGPCEGDGAGGGAGASHGSEQLTTLLGGCGGGQGAHDNSGNCDYNQGGAGGGAIRLIAAGSITIGSNGGINVGGGGGRSGVEGDVPGTDCSDSSGGGGGGSGGAIHLQAASIDLEGFLAANGGGGGGAGGMTSNFVPGQDGQLSANPASGGRMSMTPDRGAGGNGGAAGAEPVPGDDYEGGNTGGGGGAVGRILLSSGQVTPDPPTGRCSPACVISN
ncbi:MAG: hypothetical protein MJE77_46305, partial [Proteobacteria bacterium]|nr:hypothetical protein [Pseudomonadota bacterium]